ncbi:hypothetical protein CTheo_8327 [Ceratobasidium theobromae]|uniref:Uncharacterized protein n=1 Tax=Ceratobasidium theobromae TaxID=1582974 RepID=A0A5N5QA00_9AGAM|nr:hypothetical protein CTheo_8327 [Ceratobasidium theobromae]
MLENIFYKLPHQVGPEFLGEIIGIHKGLITGVYGDWDSIKPLVKSKAAQQLKTKYRKFNNWNEAVVYVNTGERVPQGKLSNHPLAPPIQHVQSAHIFSSEFPAGTIVVAPPGSIVIPYTGPITESPTVQVMGTSTHAGDQLVQQDGSVASEVFDPFNSRANSPCSSPVPFISRLLTPDVSLRIPGPPAPSTIASTPPSSPSWSSSPIFKEGLRAAALLAVPKPLRRFPACFAIQDPRLSSEIEADRRLKVIDALRCPNRALELEIDGDMIIKMLSTGRFPEDCLHKIIRAATFAAASIN